MLPNPLDLRSVTDPEILWLAEIARAIQAATTNERVMLIGAQVRELLLRWGLRVDLLERTRDVDFAIGVDDWEHFLGLRGRMLESGRFYASETLHRLRFENPTGTRVDIVPFGGVETEGRSIVWPPEHAVAMSAIGFRESYQHSTTVILHGDVTIRAASLAAFSALKLFAWTERTPSQRNRDAIDLGIVLANYGQAIGSRRLYQVPDTVLVAADGDNSLMAAWTLGRDIAEVLTSGDQAGSANAPMASPLTRLITVLRREADPEGRTQLAAEMGSSRLAENLTKLEWLRRGLEGDSGS